MLPPNPGDIPTASRRGNGRIVAVGVALGFLCIAVIVLGIFSLMRLMNAAGRAAVEGVTQGAAAESLSADDIARAHHIPDGELTIGLLNHQHLDVTWLSGADSVPLGGNKNYVSIAVGSDHVLTAVNQGFCAYGVTVSGAKDPIISKDRLPGIGTYFEFTDGTQPTATCSADSAPTSGWEPTDRSELEPMITSASA
jgi:hypothetical protein